MSLTRFREDIFEGTGMMSKPNKTTWLIGAITLAVLLAANVVLEGFPSQYMTTDAWPPMYEELMSAERRRQHYKHWREKLRQEHPELFHVDFGALAINGAAALIVAALIMGFVHWRQAPRKSQDEPPKA